MKNFFFLFEKDYLTKRSEKYIKKSNHIKDVIDVVIVVITFYVYLQERIGRK